MTPATKVAHLVKVLVPHFPVRFAKLNGEHDELREREWLRSLVEAIGSIDHDVLTAAAQRIINTRKDRRFPLPADIRLECARVVEERKERATHESLPLERRSYEFSDYRLRLADELINTPLGKQAAGQGWVLGLHTFARRHMRLPVAREIDAIRRDAAEFDAVYGDVVRIVSTTKEKREREYMSACMKLGDSMIARRRELERKLIGKSLDE